MTNPESDSLQIATIFNDNDMNGHSDSLGFDWAKAESWKQSLGNIALALT